MTDFRAPVLRGLCNLAATEDDLLDSAAADILADDTVWDVAYPFNRLSGRQAVVDGFLRPLRAAFSDVRRRDEMFIGAENRRGPGQNWTASVTHYVGNFTGTFAGINGSNKLVFLRSGEFHRIVDGKIVEAKLIIDLLDLMRQVGRFPLPRMLGTEILFPGPATHDGVLPRNGADGNATLDVVEGMLRDLQDFDPDTFDSKDQTGEDGYWHPDMLWYGPGGIGSNYRWSGFVADHRADFLRAFPDRRGGNHYCRIGDSDYAAVSGWPSMTMTHKGDYLGVPATGKALTLRVMDFYRCAGGRIMENWVLLDYVEMFHQMGLDLIAQSEAMR